MSIAETIKDYIEAKAELHEAQKDCNGTWSYYLHDEINRVQQLEDKLLAELKTVVNEFIEKALKNIESGV